MTVYAHFKKKDGRVAEEAFEILDSLPKVDDAYEGEIVREILRIETVPEIGIETIKNYDFYRLKLSVMREYEEESRTFYAAYVAVRKKKFNRLYYSRDVREEGDGIVRDEVVYANDDERILKVLSVNPSNRADALGFLRSISDCDSDDWLEVDYEEELEFQRNGAINVLAEIECDF